MARRQVQIAGCLFQIAMPQQQLNRAQIRSCFEQMRGEAMAQRVGMNRLVDAGPLGGLVASVPGHIDADRMLGGMPTPAGE